MRAAEGGAVSRVRGGEGGAILEGGETYAPAGGHGNCDGHYYDEHPTLSKSALFSIECRAEDQLEIEVA